MNTIKDVKSRSVLAEGRTNGMAFAFLKKVKEDYFETVQPLSPCKDYLNEPVFTENTGIPSRAHGLIYSKKLDIFTDVFYMAIKILSQKSGGTYYYNKEQDIKIDIKHLKDNHKNIEKLLNFVENKIGIEIKTKVEECNDDQFLLTSSVEWTVSTIAISLYSLLVRLSFVYTGKEEPLEYLKTYNYHKEDKNYAEAALKKLDIIFKNGELPSQPSFDIERAKSQTWSPHNVGLISSPIVLVEKAQVA